MKVSDILAEGQRFETVANTYRPELNGRYRTVTGVGSGVLDYKLDPGAVCGGEEGHSSGLRFRDNGDGTYTTPLGSIPRLKGHTLTIRPVTP